MSNAINAIGKIMLLFCLVWSQLYLWPVHTSAYEEITIQNFAPSDRVITGKSTPNSMIGLITNETYYEMKTDESGMFEFKLSDEVGNNVQTVTPTKNGGSERRYFNAEIGSLAPPVYVRNTNNQLLFTSPDYNVTISVLVNGEVYTGTNRVYVPYYKNTKYKTYSSLNQLTSKTIEIDTATPIKTPFELFEHPTKNFQLYGRSVPGLSVELGFLPEGSDTVHSIASTSVQRDGIFHLKFSEGDFLDYNNQAGRYVIQVADYILEEHSFEYEAKKPETLPHLLPFNYSKYELSGWAEKGDKISYTTDLSSRLEYCFPKSDFSFTCNMNISRTNIPTKIYINTGSKNFEIPIKKSLLDVIPPKATSGVVQGKTDPNTFVRVNNGFTFISARANQSGDFLIKVPPLPYSETISIEALSDAPYTQMQTKTFTLIDERPLAQLKYKLNTDLFQVFLEKTKTTIPSGKILIEGNNGTFNQSELTRSISKDGNYVFTADGALFHEGDRFTVTVEDGTGASTSFNDEVLGKETIIDPITNKDSVIQGKTAPNMKVSFYGEGNYGEESSVTSSADGRFSLPFDSLMNQSTSLSVSNEAGTQVFRVPFNVIDVIPPKVLSVERANQSTLKIQLSEPAEYLHYRTYDIGGELLQEGDIYGSSWQTTYGTTTLSNFADIHHIEILTKDQSGNEETTKFNLARVTTQLRAVDSFYEGARSILFDSVQIGDWIIVEYKGKQYEQEVRQRGVAKFTLPEPLHSNQTIKYWIKDYPRDAMTSTVLKRDFNWSLSNNEVKVQFQRQPFNSLEKTIDFYVKDERGKEIKLSSREVYQDSLMSINLPHPVTSKTQFIVRVKDSEGNTTYESTKQFDEASSLAPLSVLWNDFIDRIQVQVGPNAVLYASVNGKRVITATANHEGMINEVLPEPLINGTTWQFTLIDAQGIQTTYDVPVERHLNQFISQLILPATITQDLRGHVDPHVEILIKSSSGETSVRPNHRGDFVIAANKFGKENIELRIKKINGEISRPLILPRTASIRERVVGQTSTEINIPDVKENSTVQLVLNGKTYNGAMIKNGTFKVSHPALSASDTFEAQYTTEGITYHLQTPVILNRFPTMKVDPFLVSDLTIKGAAPSGTTVKAYVKGKLIGQTKVSTTNRFVLKVLVQPRGTEVELRYTHDNYLNTTKKIITMGVLPALKVQPVSTTSKSIIGTAERSAYVTAYIGTKQIGKRTKASTSGKFTMTIPLQSANKTITLVHEKTGYVSKRQTLRVLSNFKTLSVNRIQSSHTVISGKGERGSKVQAFVGKKSISKSTTVDSKGNYRLSIPRQKIGTNVTVKMTKSNYVTKEKTLKVVR